MSIAKSKLDDLEEGEIKDDAFEDISECSLSEALVMQEDLKDDSDVELLREEALKSLREDDEVTEEELYRLEALKSLLTNMESSEKISSVEEIRKKKRKRKKRIRRKNSSKYFKVDDANEKSEIFVESSKEWISTPQIDNLTPNTDFSNKENQIDGDVKLVNRSWYPKTDFALLNSCATEISNEIKRQPKKQWGNDDFIIVPRILSITNSDIKSAINESTPKGKPVNRSLKFNHIEIPTTRVSMPISKLNCSVLPLSPHLSRYKKVFKHPIREYPVTQPTNRFSLRNVRKGKYKIINKSCYTLKKSIDSPLTKTEKPNTVSKSVYSINRVKNQPSSSEPSEFIIELDEDDSSKEDNGTVNPDKQQNLGRIPSELNDLDELARSELPDNSISSCMAENGSLDEGITEISSSVVEKESNIDSFETSLAETQNEISVDSKDEEAMPLLEVTSSTPQAASCCDTLLTFDIIENISPRIYSEEMNLFNETKIFKVTPDALEECAVNIPTHFNSLTKNQHSLVKPEFLNAAAYFREEYNTHSIVEEEEIEPESKVTSDAIEESDVNFPTHSNSLIENEQSNEEPEFLNATACFEEEYNTHSIVEEEKIESESKVTSDTVGESDVNFPTHSNSLIENEQSNEEPEFLNATACFEEEYNTHSIVEEEEMEPESIKNLKMKENIEIDDINGTETNDCENLRVLADAEANLIEIRARLLLNLYELEESMKRDESEREKLKTMLKKLLVLKSTIFKFEDKIRAHQSKLSIHADTMQAQFKDITFRTDTYAQMKNVCFRVGMEIMGPNYTPPDVYENVIEEKFKTIDFSKYVPSFK